MISRCSGSTGVWNHQPNGGSGQGADLDCGIPCCLPQMVSPSCLLTPQLHQDLLRAKDDIPHFLAPQGQQGAGKLCRPDAVVFQLSLRMASISKCPLIFIRCGAKNRGQHCFVL